MGYVAMVRGWRGICCYLRCIERSVDTLPQRPAGLICSSRKDPGYIVGPSAVLVVLRITLSLGRDCKENGCLRCQVN